MIKRKIDVDNNVAFQASCQNNDIVLTDKGTNLEPVSYIDITGKERLIETQNVPKKLVDTKFSVGDTVKVYCKTKEGNHKRIQVFEGVVIKRQGGSNRATFTVRKTSSDIGVEKTWLLHSPNVERIEVVSSGRIRRAKLNPLRDHASKKKSIKKSTNM